MTGLRLQVRTSPWAAAYRAAFTLLEVTVAVAILVVLLTVSLQMLRALASQQRAVERRTLALQTVQALSEQIGNLPWDQVTTEAVGKVEIPALAAPHLPGAKLSVAVHEEQAPTAARRVTVSLSWRGPDGKPNRPASLTTWVFPESSQP
jgi:prepilin-type N-terminal cleavage/methylation domain-containing protein